MRKALDTFGGLSDWHRAGRCVWVYEETRCWGDNVAAHVLTRGMGGGRGDWVGCVPCGTSGEADGGGRCQNCDGFGIVGNVFCACQGHHLTYDRNDGSLARRFPDVDVPEHARTCGIDFLRSPHNRDRRRMVL